MQEYKLSICYPIYNRLESFQYVFEGMINQLMELNSPEVELVVSVNPSEVLQDTIAFLENQKKKYDFEVNVNDTNIQIGGNINQVISMAHGKFVWVVSDDDLVLPGCVAKVLNVIDTFPDLGWIHLRSAWLSGFPHRPDSVVTGVESYHDKLKAGYHKNGKEIATKCHNINWGQMLFQSANLYLREVYEKIRKEIPGTHPQLAATFASAAMCGVYIDSEVGVLAGAITTWGGNADYEIMVTFFKNLYATVGYGYEKKEIDKMVRYMMSHDMVGFWRRIFRLCLSGTDYAWDALKRFYQIMPVQMVLIIVFYPLIGIWRVLFMHPLIKYRRRKELADYRKSDHPNEMVLTHMKGRQG